MKFFFYHRQRAAALIELVIGLPMMITVMLAIVGLGQVALEKAALERGASDAMSIIVQGQIQGEDPVSVFATAQSAFQRATRASMDQYRINAGIAEVSTSGVVSLWSTVAGTATISTMPNYSVSGNAFLSARSSSYTFQNGDTIFYFESWRVHPGLFGPMSRSATAYTALLQIR